MGKAEPPPETDSGGGSVVFALMQIERGGHRRVARLPRLPRSRAGFGGAVLGAYLGMPPGTRLALSRTNTQ